jgi:hypothetical protein
MPVGVVAFTGQDGPVVAVSLIGLEKLLAEVAAIQRESWR